MLPDRHSAMHLSMLAIPLFLLQVDQTYGQTTQQQFGQNRVQYKEFVWQFYETENFITYFNKGGQELGRFASEMAEHDLREIENMLDYKINQQISILVYNTISDYNQSNIGVGEQEFYNVGGVTRIVGNKLFIYFNGSHADMRRQIREGIADVLLSSMVFGGNLQEIVQNAVLLNLPEWFVEGLIAYIGEEWNSDLDNKLRDEILDGRFDKFNKLTGADARFAGHSMWYYIAQKYGQNNIPNLLYLIRVNHSLENGFLFVLGTTIDHTIEDWKDYYTKKYESESSVRRQPDAEAVIDTRYRKKYEYHDLHISPDGKKIAYATDVYGRWKVHVQDLDEDKPKHKVFKRGGFKTRTVATDLSYPLISWSPRGDVLGIVYEKRSRTHLITIDMESGEKEEREIARFQKVLDASFLDDSRKLVISAVSKGQSDIFVYYIANARLIQVTNDFYDDLHPRYISLNNKKGILFSSNRDMDTLVNSSLRNILPVGNQDLYFYDYQKRSTKLIRITNTRHADEMFGMQYDDGHFSFLSDASGIRNRYAGYFDTIYSHTKNYVWFKDSVVLNPTFELEPYLSEGLIDSIQKVDVYKDTAYYFPVSNYSVSLMSQDISRRSHKSADLITYGGKTFFYLHNLPRDLSEPSSLQNTGFRKQQSEKYDRKRKGAKDELERKSKTDSLLATDPGFYFQSQFPGVPEPQDEADEIPGALADGNDADRDNLVVDSKFKRSRIRPYKVKYSTDYVNTQLDNSLFINQYENFTAGGGSFSQPSLSGLFTIGMTDLFEDYRFTGGFRIPTSFDGSEYYLSFEDNSKRLDKQLLYYYGMERETYNVEGIFGPVEAKVKTNIAQLGLRYPIDILRSVRSYYSYRNDRIVFLSTNPQSLELTDYKEDWVSGRFEYVFDNTFPLDINLREGMRYKIWYELHKKFEINGNDGLSLSFDDGFLQVLGMDFRHYLKIHRNLIWANRATFGHSFGTSKLVYYLGGVDSWIGAKFDDQTAIDFEAGYAFQTTATNLRGFNQNTRNGNTFAMLNSEIRWPIFSYLVNKPIRSELIRSFQVVGFFDAGSAWRGLNPFDDENRFNTVILEDGTVTTTVNFFQNPIVAGYGWGARAMIFGYFLRFDMAWGLDTGELLGPNYYFSLSLDF